MASVTYRVTGMTCEHCVRAVTQELKTLDGVTHVSALLNTGSESAVTVTSIAPLHLDAVATALNEAGEYQLA